MTRLDTQKLQESYEKLPYKSQAYTQSHPNRLATLGHIFQISPAPITQCRVLELGCASGGNIIPLAWYLPQSEFVGIDISKGQASACKKAVSDLGLSNITVHNQNIADVTDALGTFDYIICHGVFSWVPEDIQNHIFRIASDCLNERGIAYISYNTYPGWHAKEMVRNMMLYHSSHFDTLEQRLNQARASINFLADAVEKEGDRSYALVIKNELETLRQSGDWYLYHDYMEVVNTPIYFHQFCKRADRYGLQYLGEAEFGVMFSNDFSAKTNATLEEISQDIIQKEQYMDFLRNRPFRQTLLCSKKLDIRRYLDADCLASLLVASEASPEVDTVDLAPQVVQQFKIRDGFYIETASPELKTALLILKRSWPGAVSFPTLFTETATYLEKVFGLQSGHQASKKDLGRELFQCYINGGVRLTTWQNEFFNEISNRPQVSALTLYQVDQGDFIATPDHEKISLDSMSRQIVRLLDGAHDQSQILDNLQSLVRDGFLEIKQHGLPVKDNQKTRLLIKAKIDQLLSVLLSSKLLTG